MNTFKILIVCWSFIWGVCIYGLATVRMTAGHSILTFLILAEKIDAAHIPTSIPIYAFGVWAAGCLILALICLLFRRWIK